MIAVANLLMGACSRHDAANFLPTTTPSTLPKYNL